MKTKWYLICLFSFYNIGSNITAQIPTNGLVAYYPFDGDAKDKSGNGNDGIVYGASLTTDRCGRQDSAYYFNGSDYIYVRSSNNFNLNNFTFSVWIKIETYPPYSVIASATSAASIFEIGSIPYGNYGTGLGIGHSGYATNSGCTVTSGNADGTFEGFTKDPLPDLNTWYNIVITRSNSFVKLYVNDQLSYSEATKGLNPFFNNPLEIFIGTRCEFFQYFNGSIDDLMIFNRVLSDTEIASLYNMTCNNQVLSDIVGNNTVCQGQQDVEFNVQALNGVTYRWSYSGTGATIIPSGNSILVNFDKGASSGSLLLTVSGNSIQTQSKEIYITVNDLPSDPSEIIGQQNICKGKDANFNVPAIQNAASYIWNYSGNGAILNGTSDSLNIFFSDNSTDGNLTVAGYNSCGPGQQSNAFPISVISCNSNIPIDLNIPNSFTPNGDNINDLFVIRGMPANSTLIIFDRSGKKLYESSNYQNDWNGKDIDGNKLETGTYWFVLIIPGIPTEFKGFVYLKR